MSFDTAVDDVVVQVGNAGDGDGGFDAVVERRHVPAIGAATGAAGDADAVCIDFGPRDKVVDRADGVPRLNAGGRVAAGVPPPHVFAVRTVVDAFDLAELQRIDHEAHVAVTGEPCAVVLKLRFVAEADAVFLRGAMTADIEDRGQAPRLFFWEVKIARYIHVRSRLEIELFDFEVVALQCSCYDRLQRCSFRQRVEAQHFAKLPAVLVAMSGPIVPVLKFGGGGVGQFLRFAVEIGGEHLVSARGIERFGAVKKIGVRKKRRKCAQRNTNHWNASHRKTIVEDRKKETAAIIINSEQVF